MKPIDDKYGIKRVVYSTYQAVSGAGLGGYKDLENGIKGEPPKKFPHPIFSNCLPHIDVFTEDGYTKEEIKMVNETRKILGKPNMKVTATCVRVPVFASHSESINLELETPFEIEDIKKLLSQSEGIILQTTRKITYIQWRLPPRDKRRLRMGRIRRDFSVETASISGVVADNIRKGAATNAVQIAIKLIDLWENDKK